MWFVSDLSLRFVIGSRPDSECWCYFFQTWQFFLITCVPDLTVNFGVIWSRPDSSDAEVKLLPDDLWLFSEYCLAKPGKFWLLGNSGQSWLFSYGFCISAWRWVLVWLVPGLTVSLGIMCCRSDTYFWCDLFQTCQWLFGVMCSRPDGEFWCHVFLTWQWIWRQVFYNWAWVLVWCVPYPTVSFGVMCYLPDSKF